MFFAVRRSVSYQITQTDVQRFHDFAESRPRWFWETDTENCAIYETHHRDSITNNEYLATKGKPRYQVAEIDPLNEARWAAHNTQFEQHEPFQDFVCEYQAPNEEFHHIQVRGNQVFLMITVNLADIVALERSLLFQVHLKSMKDPCKG